MAKAGPDNKLMLTRFVPPKPSQNRTKRPNIEQHSCLFLTRTTQEFLFPQTRDSSPFCGLCVDHKVRAFAKANSPEPSALQVNPCAATLPVNRARSGPCLQPSLPSRPPQKNSSAASNSTAILCGQFPTGSSKTWASSRSRGSRRASRSFSVFFQDSAILSGSHRQRLFQSRQRACEKLA